MYLYIKALHIIFIVTWFSGMFYIVRLFIYNTEAGEKPDMEKNVLRTQFAVMIRRLWLGITWPSAVLTIGLGLYLWQLLGTAFPWLMIKLGFVAGLVLYHLSLHVIYMQQMRGVFRYSSMQLRIWNEVATVFLVAIVMLATVKQEISVVWGLTGLIGLMILLMSAIRIYKALRAGKK
ncbi:MAG TPA: CopD family protein [Chitinophagaceae bacterium]|nr:CopD family protein [Chitinophagaceae bacterium]